MPLLVLCLLALLLVSAQAFRFSPRVPRRISSPLHLSDAFPEAKMGIDDIKAELEMRGVDFQDCMSKGELVQRLAETRVSGKADPEILKKLAQEEAVNMDDIGDEVFDQVTSKDGNLPGGMNKEMLKVLANDPEIMKMLMDPKMQDIMQAVMAGGPEGIKKYMSDPDAMMLIERLSKTLGKFGQ